MGIWKRFRVWWNGAEEILPARGAIRAREAMLKQIRNNQLKLKPIKEPKPPPQRNPVSNKTKRKRNRRGRRGKGYKWRNH